MKTHAIRILLLLVLSISLTACGSDGGDASGEVRTSSEQILPNLLLEVDGTVEIRRTGWSEFLPAAFGAILRQGDLVRLPEGGSAFVFCGDEAAWEAGPNSIPADGEAHGVPCESARPPRPWPDVAALRGAADETDTYVVRPRGTALLDDRPTLVWESAGDGGDTLSLVSVLSDDGESRAPVQVSTGALDWPESWPPLVPGATYVLLIGEETADPDTTLGRGFWLLDEAQAGELRTREDVLRAHGYSGEAQRLVVAELYYSYGLYAEAIEELEPLAVETSAPPVWLKLGQLYLETGLPLEAQEAFMQALVRAQALGDLTSVGEAYLGLALAADLEDNPADFAGNLEEARALFNQVGDSTLLAEVERLQDR